MNSYCRYRETPEVVENKRYQIIRRLAVQLHVRPMRRSRRLPEQERRKAGSCIPQT
jgi:hypothetical protein